MEQRAGDGVLNGCYRYDSGIEFYLMEHILEGGTTDEVNLLAFEIFVGGNVVERTGLALNGYSFHFLFYGCVFRERHDNKKSRLIVMKRDV